MELRQEMLTAKDSGPPQTFHAIVLSSFKQNGEGKFKEISNECLKNKTFPCRNIIFLPLDHMHRYFQLSH
jgi:hypothetical protein